MYSRSRIVSMAPWFGLAVVLSLAIVETGAGQGSPDESGNQYIQNVERVERSNADIAEVISSHGKLCRSKCNNKGTKYYWCTTSRSISWWHNWDYCSRTSGRDYKDRRCSANSKCANHGRSYQWCYLENSGWGYCSQTSAT